MPHLLRVVDDPSICLHDLWGLGPVTCQLGELGRLDASGSWWKYGPERNPHFRGPQEYHVERGSFLDQLLAGVQLSHNDKTRVCFSEWFGPPSDDNPLGTCVWATEQCRELCYGHSVHIEKSKKTTAIYKGNVEVMYSLPDEMVPAIGDAMVYTCDYYGLDNLRWHGVGDLNRHSNRVAAYIARTYPEFMIWGFTRAATQLLELHDMIGGVRPNLLFWLSVDPTTPPKRLEHICEVARECQTGLAYFGVVGTRYTSNLQRQRAALQPTDDEIAAENAARQQIWASAADYGVPVHVCFGYHGAGTRTRLGVERECPATNPRGNGHIYAACQKCNHCLDRDDHRRRIALR